jgi:hypothetical protein
MEGEVRVLEKEDRDLERYIVKKLITRRLLGVAAPYRSSRRALKAYAPAWIIVLAGNSLCSRTERLDVQFDSEPENSGQSLRRPGYVPVARGGDGVEGSIRRGERQIINLTWIKES